MRVIAYPRGSLAGAAAATPVPCAPRDRRPRPLPARPRATTCALRRRCSGSGFSSPLAMSDSIRLAGIHAYAKPARIASTDASTLETVQRCCAPSQPSSRGCSRPESRITTCVKGTRSSHRQCSALMVQRMAGRGDGNHGDIHQPVAQHASRHAGGDDQVGLAIGDGLLGARKNGIGQRDRRVWTAVPQLAQHRHEAILRKGRIDHEAQLALPSLLQGLAPGIPGARTGPMTGRLRRSSSRPAGVSSALRPRISSSRTPSDSCRLAQRVADRGLAAVQGLGGLGESAPIHHCGQDSPLLGRGFGDHRHI